MTVSHPKNHLAFGHAVERAACHFLQKQGLLLITSNYATRGGEIDLIMRAGECVVFVEVRYRKSDRYGTPAETVTASKQRKLLQTARHYLAEHPTLNTAPCRFDVIAARPSESGLQFEWIENALGF